MSKPVTYILLLFLVGIIAYLILGDLLQSRIQKSTKNPYAFDLKEFEHVDPNLVKWHETQRFKLNLDGPKAIDFHDGKLYIAYETHLQAITISGREVFTKPLLPKIETSLHPATAVFVDSAQKIYVARKTYIEEFDIHGNHVKSWAEIDTAAYITSITRIDHDLYVANASEPEIIKYDLEGKIELRFDGTKQELSDFGFIIPSPYFDLNVDPDNELWVANTGLQHIQNYTKDGKLRAYWGNSGYDLEDFTGCCNPAHFIILKDGSFVTCEKGLVRIKVHKPSGELDSFVAPPKAFEPDAEPLDLTSDEQDNIYALDISQKLIRKFERK